MQFARIAIAAALMIAPGATAGAAPAAEGPPPAKGEAARTDLMSLYEDVCLNSFVNPANLAAAIQDRHLQPASKAEADGALQGRAGQVWAAAMPSGRYLLAVTTTPSRACAVTGVALEDDGTRAAFDLMINIYAGAHEYGPLARPPNRTARIDGKPATLQLIGATPGGQPRQAFVNMAIARPDGLADARMTREFAPAPAGK